MTTCPRCGRVADDEFVCADCGAFLAGGEGEPAAAVRIGRVAVLVLVVCLLGAVGAVLLLRDSGGGDHRADLSIPLVSGPVELSSVPLGAPGESGSGHTSGSASGHPTTSAASSSASPTRSASTSAHWSTSAAPTGVRPSSSASRSTPPAPHPSTSHSSSTVPPSTTRPPPVPPSVRLAKGGASSCGPHCYSLVVTLAGFGGGSHHVSCFSGHAGEFGSYSTSATTSSGCSYGHPHDTVWVFVAGTRSNTVPW